MSTCQNCVFWRSGGEYKGYTDPGETETENWRLCELTLSSDTLRDFPESKAVAIDGEGCGAMLWTAPDFGCNQFKERNDNDPRHD